MGRSPVPVNLFVVVTPQGHVVQETVSLKPNVPFGEDLLAPWNKLIAWNAEARKLSETFDESIPGLFLNRGYTLVAARVIKRL